MARNMTTPHTEYCSMFGAFNLRHDVELSAFKYSFDAFCEHFHQQGHVHSWRLWERAFHKGYDSNFPDVRIMLEMCFHNYEASLISWDLIEEGGEPLKSLHIHVIEKVVDSIFVLHREVN